MELNYLWIGLILIILVLKTKNAILEKIFGGKTDFGIYGCILKPYPEKPVKFRIDLENKEINDNGFIIFEKFKYFFDINECCISDIGEKLIYYREKVTQPIRIKPISNELIFSIELLKALENKQIQELRNSEQIQEIKEIASRVFWILILSGIAVFLLFNITKEFGSFKDAITPIIDKIVQKIGA